jgi:peptidoglycan/LPS O-acetylase OafA/YrhL
VIEGGGSRVVSQEERRRLPYRADIDGLRAVAVLSVTLFHAFPSVAPGGFTGVDIFFVISGFLITSILSNKLQLGEFSIAAFYAARARRIFPALSVVLLSSFVFGAFVLLRSEFASLANQVVASALFVANIYYFSQTGYFTPAALTKPLLHIWSLGVEEQFYLIWPLLMFAAYRLKCNQALAALFIVALSFVVNVATVEHHQAAAFFLPMARLWELAIGACLASLDLARVSRGVRNVLSIVGLGLVLCGFIYARDTDLFPGWVALLPVLGSASVIAAGPTGIVNRHALSFWPLVGLGLISYPLYLWHWPLLSFSQILAGGLPTPAIRGACVVAAVILAYATYRWIEKPVRRSHAWRIPATLATGLAAIAALAFVAPRLEHRLLPPIDDPASIAYTDGWQEMVNSCGIPREEQDLIGTCYTDRREPPANAIWGDSHAGQLMFGLFRASSPGHRWVAMASAGCPPMLGVQIHYHGGSGYDTPVVCKNTNRIAMERFEKSADIKNVLLVTAARIITAPIYGKEGTSGIYPEAIADGIIAAAQKLHSLGKNVYFLIDSPDFSRPQNCAQRPIYVPAAEPPVCTKTLEEHLRERAAYLSLVKHISVRAPFMKILDPTKLLCPNGTCASRWGNDFLYTDGDHYSNLGNGIVGRFVVNSMDQSAITEK